jgi:hypothetical protein
MAVGMVVGLHGSSATDFTSKEECTGEHQPLPRQLDHRHEVLHEIGVDPQHMGRAGDIVVGNEDGIAVGRTLGRRLDADHAAGAELVLEIDLPMGPVVSPPGPAGQFIRP